MMKIRANVSRKFDSHPRSRMHFAARLTGARAVLLVTAFIGTLVAACSSAPDPSTTGSAGGGTSAGGGGAQSGGGASGVTLTSACKSKAASFCERMAACTPTQLSSYYGTTANCREVEEEICVLWAEAKGSEVPPDGLKACADAIAQSDCKGFLRSRFGVEPPAACVSLGTHPASAPCFRGDPLAQCAPGLSCGFDPSAQMPVACGICAAAMLENHQCDHTEDCVTGFWCDNKFDSGMPGVCVRLSDLGEPCFSNKPCEPDLSCKGNTCVPMPGIGEPCSTGWNLGNFSLAPCQFSARCGANGLCEPEPLADVGAPCNVDSGAPDFTECHFGGTCVPAHPATYSGTCVVALKEGEAPCWKTLQEGGATTLVNLCEYPLLCNDAVKSGGVCQLWKPGICL
jgi:hypothetical protein